jgi:hypothetical protein
MIPHKASRLLLGEDMSIKTINSNHLGFAESAARDGFGFLRRVPTVLDVVVERKGQWKLMNYEE